MRFQDAKEIDLERDGEAPAMAEEQIPEAAEDKIADSPEKPPVENPFNEAMMPTAAEDALPVDKQE